jgi:Outer membrane lipoprotein carrier protein LolA-like
MMLRILTNTLISIAAGLVGSAAFAFAPAKPPAVVAKPPTVAAASPAANGDLDEVMNLLALRKHGHVEFVEQRFLAVLNHPLESSGELRFDAPDHLEQRTLKPRAESLVLDAGTLTVDRGHTHRVTDLHSYPQIEPFIESIRATLAGDRKALEHLFHLEFFGGTARWTLTLVPLESKAKQLVAQVKIDGVRDQLLKVEIRQTDGDRSLMTLRPSAAP